MALDAKAGFEAARLLAYVRRYGVREHPVMQKCRLETLKQRTDAMIMTPPEEAAFVGFFLRCLGLKRGLEIGVFTGYSSLAIGMALPEDGSLVACEVDAEAARIAAGYWKEAGIANKVSCIVGDARKSLEQLRCEGKADTFDFAYIDADKQSYDFYYEACLSLVRNGGIIIIDNTLWGGRVADRRDTAPETEAIRQLNEKLYLDDRVDLVQTVLGDGTTFIRKRERFTGSEV